MDTTQLEKTALRRTLTAVERGLTAAEKQASDAAIIRHVLSAEEYRLARTVFAFVGRGREIDTMPLLRQILADRKRLCVPLCTGKGIMECRQVRDLSILRPGAYGIPEPPAGAREVPGADTALSLVPCGGAPAGGWRRGGGGGFYARFLARYAGGALLLCRRALPRPDIPRQPHDTRTPAVITEQGRVQAGAVPDTAGR